MRGYEKEPQIGDKVISLRNHWDVFSSSGTWALTNGSIGVLKEYMILNKTFPRYITQKQVPYMFSEIELEDKDFFPSIPIDYIALTTGTPALDGKETYLVNKSTTYSDAPYEFAYAYAITTHKAQGSEWDKVLVVEERFPFDEEEHRRWLYTAITRAKEKLVIVRS